MKKIFLLASLCLMVATATVAQTADSFKSPYSVTTDTVTNSGTAYLTIACNTKYEKAVIVAIVTEISGTTAGTLTLKGSLDGTTYVALTDTTAVPEIETETPTDVTTAQPFVWVIDNLYPYLQVHYAGTGTMSAQFSAKRVEIRRKD